MKVEPELVQENVDKLNSEIRRGAIVLAVLSQLHDEHYGYSLRRNLLEQGLEVEEGTLYPLIRRLEKHGLLVSHWREEARRRKRFYQHSELGRAVYAQLLDDWNALNASISQLTHTDLNTADQQGDR